MASEKKELPQDYPAWIGIRARHEHRDYRGRTEEHSEADDREYVWREGVKFASLGAMPRGVPKRRCRINRTKNHRPN